MSAPSLEKYDIFCAPGHAFADFGCEVPPDKGLERAQKIAQLLVRHEDAYSIYGIARSFDEQDAPDLPQSGLEGYGQIIGRPVEWIASASISELQVFASWMQRRHVGLRTSFEREKEGLFDSVSYGLFTLEDNAMMTHEMAHKAHELCDTVPLRAMSSFESGTRFVEAVCRGSRGHVDMITVANLFEDRERQDRRAADMGSVLLHEELHAYGLWQDVGFMHGLTKPGQPSGLVEEVTVAHMQAVADSGQPEVLNPSQRIEVLPGRYKDARLFIALLSELGPASIPSELLCEAWATLLDDTVTRSGHPRITLESRLKRNTLELLPDSGGFYEILQDIKAVHPLRRAGYIQRINIGMMARAEGLI